MKKITAKSETIGTLKIGIVFAKMCRQWRWELRQSNPTLLEFIEQSAIEEHEKNKSSNL